MNELTFDSGIEEFSIAGGGVLRFNPSDPNLYARFLEATETLGTIEGELSEKAKALEDADTAQAVIGLLAEADRKIKQLLNEIFPGNDFDAALGGVNLLAITAGGQRVVTNLFAALEEILTAGADRFVSAQVSQIKEKR